MGFITLIERNSINTRIKCSRKMFLPLTSRLKRLQEVHKNITFHGPKNDISYQNTPDVVCRVLKN